MRVELYRNATKPERLRHDSLARSALRIARSEKSAPRD
jgi:hypothetical protein